MPYPTPYTDEYMRVLCNWITTRRMDPEIATWSRIDPAGRPTPPTVIVQHPHAEDVSDEVHAELTRAGWVAVHQSDAPRETFYQPLDRATMTVTVRDRSRESNYYYGPFFATVTIPRTCPVCGGPRGNPVRRTFAEDGAFYTVDQWENPCGHIDMYADVIEEGRRYAERQHTA